MRISLTAIGGFFFLTSTLFSGISFIVDNCDSSLNLKLECIGASNSSVEVSSDFIEGKGALRLIFIPEQSTIEEVKMTCRKTMDLSLYERLEFWVKGLAPGRRYKFILTDFSGKEMVTEFNPGLMVEDITRLPWRRVTIRLEKEKIDLAMIESYSVVITDEDSPRSHRKTELLIDYIAVFTGPPPENLSFRYPEELSLKKKDNLNVLYVREPMEIIKDRWNLKSILESIDQKVKIEESIWNYIPYKYGSELSYFPSFYSQLTKYNLVILQSSELPKKEYQQMLKDYVEGGGSILILGGYASLGKSNIEESIFSDIIPVKTEGPWDMIDGSSLFINIESKLFSGINLPAEVFLPWYQKTTVKSEATVELKIGEDPLLITWQYGKGRVAVFTGTVLGEKNSSGKIPFWKWEGYSNFKKEIILLLIGDKQ